LLFSVGLRLEPTATASHGISALDIDLLHKSSKPRLTLLATVIGLAISCGEVLAQELSVAQKVEGSVVILTHSFPVATNVMGTGFVVSTNGLVVTADHIVLNEKTGTLQEPIFAIWNLGMELRTVRMKVSHRFKQGTSGRDLAILEPVTPSRIGSSHLDIGSTAIVGDGVIIAGYPLVWDRVKPYPLLRRGSIASTKYDSDGDRVLVLDLPSLKGYSGSPVVDANTGLVVGVLSRAPKRPETGFSLAYVITSADLRPNR